MSSIANHGKTYITYVPLREKEPFMSVDLISKGCDDDKVQIPIFFKKMGKILLRSIPIIILSSAPVLAQEAVNPSNIIVPGEAIEQAKKAERSARVAFKIREATAGGIFTTLACDPRVIQKIKDGHPISGTAAFLILLCGIGIGYILEEARYAGNH